MHIHRMYMAYAYSLFVVYAPITKKIIIIIIYIPWLYRAIEECRKL